MEYNLHSTHNRTTSRHEIPQKTLGNIVSIHPHISIEIRPQWLNLIYKPLYKNEVRITRRWYHISKHTHIQTNQTIGIGLASWRFEDVSSLLVLWGYGYFVIAWMCFYLMDSLSCIFHWVFVLDSFYHTQL